MPVISGAIKAKPVREPAGTFKARLSVEATPKPPRRRAAQTTMSRVRGGRGDTGRKAGNNVADPSSSNRNHHVEETLFERTTLPTFQTGSGVLMTRSKSAVHNLRVFKELEDYCFDSRTAS